ncbi:MAG: hypothetical protein HYZ68_03960 [Chloroflexi bacterium]|nr:hypothetical protein [Chloroflexota bacterium]
MSKLSAAVGAILGAISCASMIAVSLVGFLGFLGSAASTQLIAPLAHIIDPLWAPLLLVSLLLIVLGLSRRGRLAVALATAGGLLTFVGMALASPPGVSRGMAGMTGPGAPASSGGLVLVVFWSGVALIAVAFISAYRPQAIRMGRVN